MLKFKGLFERALQGTHGEFVVTFITTDRRAVAELGSIDVAEFQCVEVKKFCEKRSINANAYFHVLCDKIGAEMNMGIEQVKQMLVWDFGTPKTDADGEIIFIRLPKSVIATEIYKYAKWYQDSPGTKKPCCDYIVYKETHTLDTKEMARLIDGTIQQAKELNIETRTPAEIADMMDRWEKGE